MTGTKTKSIVADDKGMSIEEVRRFEQLDGRIERGVRTFLEVGQSLAEIHADRLYRKDFASFDAYCDAKGISQSQAYELMGTVEVDRNLRRAGGIAPNLTSIRQATELSKLPDDQQADAFIEASERTNGKPTAAAIKQVVAERKAPAVTFGDINTDDEPTANDADERERKADAKQFVDDAPMLALAQAEAGRTFHGRKVPDDAPSLNLKEIRDNDPAVRWMRILSDLADCVSRLPDPSSLGQLPQEKRKYVNLRIGEIAATLQEVIK